jgi:hypothetical protein
MDAAITLSERLARLHAAQAPSDFPDHRARHLANAREWLRRLRLVEANKGPEGADANAIRDSFLWECKHGNLDPNDILPALDPRD